MTPNNIDRYEVRGEIGRGGMATVLKGYDPRFKRDVAIKLLPREFLHDPQFRARFQREAQTIAALEHPAIVPVYDFGDADGQLYLVMRLMTGGSLADRLEKGPLSITETARIFERLAPALDSAHALGIIHRDLKPANILFDQWNNPYLSDFGIAKLVAGSSTALTATGGLVGTPAYMSPEQVRGVDALDGRSDIYAMGVILFQMLTGKLPYNANTPIGLAFMHVTEPVPNILDSNTSLPHAYQSVIEQAMAKERGARPRTTVELADTVSSLALGENDNRTILDSEVKETIVEPLPDRVETEQLELAESELPSTTNLPLTALEDELHQDKWGKYIPEEKPQGAVLPQSATELDNSTNRRVPIWGWGVLGLIVVAALIGLSTLWGGRDEHADESVDTAVAAVALIPTATFTFTATVTSRPVVVLSSTAVPSSTSIALSTNTLQPAPTKILTSTASKTPHPTSTSMPESRARVIYSSINIRSGPSVNFDSIGTLNQDDIVIVVARNEEGKWYNVKLASGSLGWVSSSTVEIVDGTGSQEIVIASTIPVLPTSVTTATPNGPRAFLTVSPDPQTPCSRSVSVELFGFAPNSRYSTTSNYTYIHCAGWSGESDYTLSSLDYLIDVEGHAVWRDTFNVQRVNGTIVFHDEAGNQATVYLNYDIEQ